MIKKIFNFFKTGKDVPPLKEPAKIKKLYSKHRWSVFLSITFGYGFFYVARLTLSVVKKPMIDEGIFDAKQLGMIGSALLFTYAFGKFTNGVLADRLNIKKFFSMGLFVSALLNLFLGFTTNFWIFFCLWGLNGWFQAMGAAPSVVALNQWFSNRERGTRYGIWYISHSIGEGITFAGTSVLVSILGWRAGFWGPGIVCAIVAIILYYTMADRPQTFGLPSIADYNNDHVSGRVRNEALWRQQAEILKNPYVWILGLSSALAYVARYGINNWGILYLQEMKSYSLVDAGAMLSVAPIIGVFGGAFSGWFSDKFFNSSRNIPTLIYGLLQTGSLIVLFFAPPGHRWVDMAAIAVFGFAISGTIAFLGGLIAVDLCPKRVTGAVMGFIGLFSYMGASIQDWISGTLINDGSSIVNGRTIYNFDAPIYFWVGASALSMLLACTVWKAKPRD